KAEMVEERRLKQQNIRLTEDEQREKQVLKEENADKAALRSQHNYEKLYHAYRRSTFNTNDVFCFVLLSDGCDTVNEEEEIDKALLDGYNLVRGSGMRSIFKVVGIGRESDTRLGMRCKLAAETMTGHAGSAGSIGSGGQPCYYARHSK